MITSMAYIIVDTGDATVTFVVALFFVVLFIPCSFCLWYRPSYNAFKYVYSITKLYLVLNYEKCQTNH